jgi:hypothetical protein
MRETAMICLTGDVHHMSLRTNDQRFLTGAGETEVRVTQRYVSLLEKHDVKCTLYVNGKCFTEEWRELEPVAKSSLIEVGGHGYRARQPRWLFDWYGARTGNWNGPRAYQAWDIRRNVQLCEKMVGKPPLAWRAHSYKVDPNTYPLLAHYGIKLVSDVADASNLWPVRIEAGLISHPMNVIPDHDHLYHAHRDREFVAAANARGYGADDFGAVSYTIEEWGQLVLQQAQAIERKEGLVTVLAHPVCMYLADGFRTFEKLLEYFGMRQTIWASEIIALVDDPPPAA